MAPFGACISCDPKIKKLYEMHFPKAVVRPAKERGR